MSAARPRRGCGITAVVLAVAVTALAVGTAAHGAGARVLRLPFPHEDGSLTPYTFALGYPLVTLVYDTLLWRDAGGVPRPWLARSVTTSPDGRTLTVRLRDHVRWHDGRPLTAEDVAFTFRFVAGRFQARFTPELADVADVRAADRTTVVIRLRRRSLGFVDQPLADLPILPAHLWRDLPPGRAAPPGLPVGSGPYRLVSHRPGREYRFRANRRYFRGHPLVSEIRVPVISDAERTFRALEESRVDMIPVSLPDETAQRLQALSTRIRAGPSYLGTVLVLNLRRAPFSRRAVRRALAGALDLDRIAQAVGTALPADRGYLHPRSPWAPAAVLHRFAPRAPALRGLHLPALHVLAPSNDPVKLEAARQVALAWQRAGVRAQRQVVSRAALERALGAPDSSPIFTAAVASSSPLASYDPDFLGRLFQAPNSAGYRNPVFTRLTERAGSAPSPAERRRAVTAELRVLEEDAPVVPLFFSEGAFAYRPARYDGWVFVKGTGILDKQSFLPRRPVRSEPRPVPAEPASTAGVGPLGVAALALAGLAMGLGALALVRRGR